MSSLESAVRELFADYFHDVIQLPQLGERLGALIVAADEDHDPEAQRLVYEAELRLAEYSNGDWSEQEFRHLLERSSSRYSVPTGFDRRATAVTSTYQIVNWQPLSPRVDIQLRAVPA